MKHGSGFITPSRMKARRSLKSGQGLGLIELGEKYGGLNMRCCGPADHQCESLQEDSRYVPGVRPAIDAFSLHPVFVHAWIDDNFAREAMNLSKPDTRRLFNMPAQ